MSTRKPPVSEQRIAFEAWFKANNTTVSLVRTGHGYIDNTTRVAWRAWQAASVPAARTDQQIVDQTEELAVWLLSWCFNHQPETNSPMRESTHPFAERCWAAACHIQEMLTATDPENALAELDADDAPPAPPAQPAVQHLPADDTEGGST